jgi:SAM-dependent methyltransferase
MGNARYRWTVEILDVQPADVILEIGCGYGHSIPLISEELVTGHLTAIDRSEKMVAAASAANRQLIASGRATVVHQDLLDRKLATDHFDKIFLFNINVFWMDPRDELAEIKRLLRPIGRFYLFQQPPPGHDLEEFEESFHTNLDRSGFQVIGVSKNKLDEVRSVTLISTPNPQ